MKHILAILALTAAVSTVNAQTTVVIETQTPEPEVQTVVVEQPVVTQVVVEKEVVVVEKEGPTLLGALGKLLGPEEPRRHHEPKKIVHRPIPEPKKVIVVEKPAPKPEPKKVIVVEKPKPEPKKPEPRKPEPKRDEPRGPEPRR